MKSLEELKAIRNKMQGQVGLRAEDSNQTRVVVGMATCGIASGARPVLNALSGLVQEKGLTGKVAVTQTGCIGLCQYEPIVEVMEPGKSKITYIKMNPDKAAEIVERHLIGGHVVEEYTLNSADIK
ncbi:(2Fe-2S) ferredoxin domain-containing protein [Clostridiaceae bacterium]|nr:(2Fe-2S) ferredoxin domain-containing protein [Lachnospiraceae bacterium]MCI9162149.1 (2Fe-2S) ferredoxin domain-containing protein [Lachnospiraceae bacterium]NBH71703.1 (2Fe-2S) ferredoxin domain-containing protein [Clostridiaceae bacterium]RKI17416.1 (2Fe-2S) ferredoxin domain-containing protein [bacterium 1XD21-70]